ncbi:MAG TPA: DUF1850 domain-containing protein [Thermodesulfobacteriota bacterium]
MSRLALLAACLLLGACTPSPPIVLEVGSPSGDVVYARRAVEPGDRVIYRFVHSVSRTPVEETWEVVNGPSGAGLRLRRIVYQASGAGLPSSPEAPGATFERTADGFVVDGLDRAIGLPLDLRVTPAAENAITVGGETIDLTRLRGPSPGAPVSLVRLTLG